LIISLFLLPFLYTGQQTHLTSGEGSEKASEVVAKRSSEVCCGRQRSTTLIFEIINKNSLNFLSPAEVLAP
jgi:hypothetical protein